MAVAQAERTATTYIRRCSLWREGELPTEIPPTPPADIDGVVWFDVVATAEAAPKLLEHLRPYCPGITTDMLEDLLTPDEEPQGTEYARGEIRLASSFSVEGRRMEKETPRGTPQRAGALFFQPVELLAGERWLVTCWHPLQPYDGANRADVCEPGSSDEVFRSVAKKWAETSARTGGDLGVLIMHRLAGSYKPAIRTLEKWLDDWELSLYVEDDLSNPEELPRLWGSMAVLRDWLKVLNRPGLRVDPDRAWLPVSDLGFVIDVDDRIDRALDLLRPFSQTLRSSFDVLHVQLAEEERERRESVQRRVELAAAIFLVPTLIVGFYGANTWVPGQQRHWGFWAMVAILVITSVAVVLFLLRWQRRQAADADREAGARRREHAEMIKALSR